MRRRTILLLLAALTGSDTASAQGFGFLFGAPLPSYRRTSRGHRPIPVPVEVPMPVPRPRFPGDSAPGAATPSSDPAATVTSSSASASAPPLPPERPAQADRATAPKSAPPQVPVDTSKPDRPKAPVLTVPVPAVAPPVPAVAPSGATTAFNPRDPTPDAGCADRLKARGVTTEATVPPPQPDARCTVVQPMRLVSATSIDGTTVTFPDKPTIACATVDAFSAYVRDLLAPLAKGTWGVAVTSVWTGPGLECRSRDHIFGAKLSAHGQGLAVDIAQLALADGRHVAVGEPKTDTERDFETAARAGACGYFHTVLGPGSDTYHRTHWHFDLEVRGREGESKYCK